MNEQEYDKIMEAYQKYLVGDCYNNVKTIILDGGKVVFIKGENGALSVPSARVEGRDTIYSSAIREAKEKVGYEVVPLGVVDKSTYTMNLKFGDLDFPSKREVNFLVLKATKKEGDGALTAGESLYLGEVDELKKLHLAAQPIEAVRNFLLV